MLISDIIAPLEARAPLFLQESYDNSGLLVGEPKIPCTGVLIALDATKEVVREAVRRNCNLIITHHPVIFQGLKRITGANETERVVLSAIRNQIALYAAHTNLDNTLDGVSGKMAEQLGLTQVQVLQPKKGLVGKLQVYVPHTHLSAVESALFDAGAGQIGPRYSECRFVTEGVGSFKPMENATPFSGEKGARHFEPESCLELIFPVWKKNQVLQGLRQAHPYEEIAYEISTLENADMYRGSGVVGKLPQPMEETSFLQHLKQCFGLTTLRHSALRGKPIHTVALCGGAGSFLVKDAINCKSDIYITSDLTYHRFFEAENQLVLADIGHWESEQFTIDLIHDILHGNFPTFAILKTEVGTNPVRYYPSK